MTENMICMKQLSLLDVKHALRPYIDTEINYIRHFIKIPFINKGIKFIDLSSIFRDDNVISAIPLFFENTKSPIICYKYNRPIRNTVILYFIGSMFWHQLIKLLIMLLIGQWVGANDDMSLAWPAIRKLFWHQLIKLLIGFH